jgi:hypothetical protein
LYNTRILGDAFRTFMRNTIAPSMEDTTRSWRLFMDHPREKVGGTIA